MKITKLLNSSAAAVLSGVLALGQMGSALADDAAPGQQQQAQPVSIQTGEMTSAQKRDVVSEYSMENGGRVGMFINIAPSGSLTPAQIGDGLVNKFARDGIEATYVVNYARAGESTVTFYMNGLVWAGYSLGSVREAYAEIIKSHRALRAEQRMSGAPNVEDTLALNNP